MYLLSEYILLLIEDVTLPCACDVDVQHGIELGSECIENARRHSRNIRKYLKKIIINPLLFIYQSWNQAKFNSRQYRIHSYYRVNFRK